MKHRLKLKRVFPLVLILIMIICTFSGCSKSSKLKKNGEIYLYYTNKDRTKLISKTYKPEGDDTVAQVEEVLNQMNTPVKKKNCITAKPESVEISGYTLYDKTVNIDFSSSYYEMSKVTELLCRSAIVLSITQLKGVDYVIFTVNSQPLVLDGNNEIGSMKAEDFVAGEESNINSFQNLNIVVYYADKDGKNLVAEEYSGVYDTNTSVEKLILEKLISGPELNQYQRTIPSNVKLLSVMTKDGICYVNFDNSFLTESTDVSPELEIYSIVNSLCELSYINKVQISINGETNVKFKDSISLEYTFTRNLDIVK